VGAEIWLVFAFNRKFALNCSTV